MEREVEILIVEDDDGHAELIRTNLSRAGFKNGMHRFKDGQEIVDFLFSGEPKTKKGYLMLLDINMPKIDGTEVLRRVKTSELYKTLPVIMLTTTDDPREVKRCHDLGCNSYVAKPVDYEEFIGAVQQLGLFLKIVEIPKTERI